MCADWVLVDAACSAYSMVSVPLYDTLGPDAVRYICGHAELAAVACAAAVLPTLLQCLSDCPTVSLVVHTPASYLTMSSTLARRHCSAAHCVASKCWTVPHT